MALSRLGWPVACRRGPEKSLRYFSGTRGRPCSGAAQGGRDEFGASSFFFLRQGEEESTELSTTTSRPKRVKGEREKSLCFFFTLYFFLNFFSLSSGVPLSCLHSRETRVQSEALLCLIYTKLKTEEGIR